MSQESWINSYFHLPFRTSFQPNEFAGEAAERIIAKPINEGNKYWLYMRFLSETTHVLRVIVVYRCTRYFQVDANKSVYMSHQLEQ